MSLFYKVENKMKFNISFILLLGIFFLGIAITSCLTSDKQEHKKTIVEEDSKEEVEAFGPCPNC